MPISDTFAIRIAGMDLERDGFINNNAAGQIATGPSNGGSTIIKDIDSDVDGRDLYTYRISAAWDITDQANAWLSYGKFRENDDKVRINNQVCQKSTLPVYGCDPDGFGFDTPNAGATTGGVFGGLIGAVSGGLGNPAPPAAFPQLTRRLPRDAHRLRTGLQVRRRHLDAAASATTSNNSRST